MNGLRFLLLIISFSFLGCTHLFYHPSQREYVDVSKLEIQPQEIEITDEGGEKISAWLFKPAQGKAKARLIFFHGNAENITSHFRALYWILYEGYEFLIFDYPGYGKSSGKPTPQSTTQSGREVLRWTAAQKDSPPLAVFGQSLGGNIALYSVIHEKEVPLCMVAVESTFKSYRKVAQRVAGRHWLTWLLQPLAYVVMTDAYAAGERIAEIAPTPLLVMHGEADTIVDIRNGEDVFAAAESPKEFWRVPGGYHIQAFFGEKGLDFRQRFIGFLEQSCVKKK
ncbi:MAG: alpha/beta hydrolase [Bdellovibrio sp.]